MKQIKIIGITMIIVILISSVSVMGMNSENSNKIFINSKFTDKPYNGHLRVYVVEPESRWDNYDGDPYHFGFLDYAINQELSINYI